MHARDWIGLDREQFEVQLLFVYNDDARQKYDPSDLTYIFDRVLFLPHNESLPNNSGSKVCNKKKNI
jgi:hypothetical protein